MIDSKVATELAEKFRQAGGFQPFLLALVVLAHGTGDYWEPPSKAALKRSLRRPKDHTALSDSDLDAIIRHAVAMGLLSSGSTPARLLLDSGRGESR